MAVSSPSKRIHYRGFAVPGPDLRRCDMTRAMNSAAEHFNDGDDHWCQSYWGCISTCGECLFCCNYGSDPDAKCRAFADWLAEEGYESTRPGFRRKPLVNVVKGVRRMKA